MTNNNNQKIEFDKELFVKVTQLISWGQMTEDAIREKVMAENHLSEFTAQELINQVKGEISKMKTDTEKHQNSLKVEQQQSFERLENIAYEYKVSGGRRFFGYLIDMFALYIFAFVFGIVLATMSLDFSSYGDNFYTFVGLVLMFVFYLLFEGLFKMTPGKMVLGMKVVAPDGSSPSFGAIFVRTLCRFVPFDGLSYFWSDGCWHSSWSNTVVVSRKELKEALEETIPY